MRGARAARRRRPLAVVTESGLGAAARCAQLAQPAPRRWRRARRADGRPQRARVAGAARLRACAWSAPAHSTPRRAERGARPAAGRRQRRQHPAQRGGLRLRAGAGAQGHGGAVVAQGAARRHGRALRAAPGRGARAGGARRAARCRWSPRARTPAQRARRGGAALALRLGASATKGRASRRRCWQRCARQLRIPQPGGEESLNVAAAAAVCLYESARQRAAGASACARAVSTSAGRAGGRAGSSWRSPRSTCGSSSARRCPRAASSPRPR